MIKPYGIYLIEFPFSDLSQSKLRPALALTNENRVGEAIFCFISSQLFSKDEVDIEVRPSKQNGLKMPSIIKIDKIATLSNRYEKRVKGRIGQLEYRYVSKVKRNLKNLFHFS